MCISIYMTQIKKRYFTKEEDEVLYKYYPDNGSVFCSQFLKMRSLRAIRSRVSYLKLKISSKKKRNLIRSKGFDRPSDYYDINPEQFYKIEKPEVAYFLGYFWADGHLSIKKLKRGSIYTITMSINYEDFLNIENTLALMGKWRLYDKMPSVKFKRPNRAKTISTGNMPLVKYLHSLDLHKKSLVSPTKILSKIPDHLKHYFWRGYFDGDGTISKENLSCIRFSGSYSQDWSDLIALFEQLGIKKFSKVKNIRHRGGESTVITQGRESIRKLGNYLYKDRELDQIGLDRKYLRWKKIEINAIQLEKSENIIFCEPRDFLTSEIRVLELINNYSGFIIRRKILDYFNLSHFYFDQFCRSLKKKGFVITNKKIGEKPYLITETGIEALKNKDIQMA